MNTNATVALSNNNQQATLTLGGQTLIMQLRSPSGAQFATAQPERQSSDPTTTNYGGSNVQMSPDQPSASSLPILARSERD